MFPMLTQLTRQWINWASLAPIYVTLQDWGYTIEHLLEGEICVTATMRMRTDLVEVIRLAYDANHRT